MLTPVAGSPYRGWLVLAAAFLSAMIAVDGAATVDQLKLGLGRI